MILARLVLLGASVAPLVTDLFRPDEPAAADEDLRTYRKPVPDSRNGFIAVNLDAEEIAWPEDGGPRLTGQEEPFDVEAATRVVKESEDVLERLDLSLASPDFQVPEAESFDDPVGYLLTFRRIAYVVSARGRLLFETGDEEAALRDALRLIRLGQRIQGAQGPLISFLVGMAIQSIGCHDFIERLRWMGFKPDALTSVLKDLAPIDADIRGFGDALRAEYTVVSRSFERLARGEPAGLDREPSGPGGVLVRSPFFRLERTKRLLGEDLRAILRVAGRPLIEERLVPAEERYDLEHFKPRLLTCAGEVILRSLIPVYERALSDLRLMQFQLAAAKVLLALECHRAERGTLPASLDDLVPRLLDRIPRDPYDGKPLRWSREKLSLYSVGSDLVDSGGSEEAEWRKALVDSREPTACLRTR